MVHAPFVFRMVVAVPRLLIASNTHAKLGELIVTLFLLDTTDCAVYKALHAVGLTHMRPDCKSHEFQRMDKIADAISYVLALLLFRNLFPPGVYALLWALLAWRVIGVAKYYKRDDNAILHTHFDGINGVMLALFLSNTFQSPALLWPLIALSLYAKTAFERFLHPI